MRFVPMAVEDCTVVVGNRHHDDRGFFQELYEEDKYQHGGVLDQVEQRWQQANWSFSRRNVLRGIHHANYSKLVTCVSGKIWDVVVDLRPKSPTFLKWVGQDLWADEPMQMYVPPGCGHGFYAYEDSAVVYMQSGRYAKEGELNIMYNEPYLNIPWPGDNHIISERDRGGNPLWSFLTCLPEEINFSLYDQIQETWVNSLSPEEQADWRKKFPSH